MTNSMEIVIVASKFTGATHWDSKLESVVLVETKENIEPLWNLLCEQDGYWEHYKHLIKVAPLEINGIGDLSKMCEYCGKTDIYDINALQDKITFLIYQDRY